VYTKENVKDAERLVIPQRNDANCICIQMDNNE
jgi:hypothetical protein